MIVGVRLEGLGDGDDLALVTFVGRSELGDLVGESVGLSLGAVGSTLGLEDGAAVGIADGAAVGLADGAAVGLADGTAVGVSDGTGTEMVGVILGLDEGATLGVTDGDALGLEDGTALFGFKVGRAVGVFVGFFDGNNVVGGMSNPHLWYPTPSQFC